METARDIGPDQTQALKALPLVLPHSACNYLAPQYCPNFLQSNCLHASTADQTQSGSLMFPEQAEEFRGENVQEKHQEYVQSPWALIDKHLVENRFLSRLGLFAFLLLIFVSDNYFNKFDSLAGILLYVLKAGVILGFYEIFMHSSGISKMFMRWWRER